MENIKNNNVLIFDWDDTLINAGPTICDSQFEACKIILAKKEQYPFTKNWLQPKMHQLQECIGMRFYDTIIPRIFPQIDYDNNLHIMWANNLYDTFKAIYKNKPKQLFEGVFEKLLELKKTGYTLTIATNKSRELFLYEMFIIKIPENFFEFIVCGDDPIINGNFKPKPDMINLTQTKFSNAKTFTMIGDSDFDIKAAKKSTSKCYAVAINKKGNIQQQADLYLDSVADITESLLENMIRNKNE